MTTRDQLRELLELAGACGIEVRREPLGGDGGGLCHLRGRAVLFVDTSADLATQLHRCVTALSSVAAVESHYVRPELRELLEKQDKSPS